MPQKNILTRLESRTEVHRIQFREGFSAFARLHGLEDWEGWFSPYDEEIYRTVLAWVGEDDVVLEIGAGDLRLSLQLAEKVRLVYAVEVNPLLLASSLEEIGFELPRNLFVICANALDFPVPPEITVAVLLMRHCRHFGVYFARLQKAGCRRLITNARWKSGVEQIDLTAPRLPLSCLKEGWYACACGAVGYVGEGDLVDAPPVEVIDCPHCVESSHKKA